MKTKLLFFILIIYSFFLHSCGKKECEGKRGISYLFELPINIYPTKDTFYVGDTIWIEQNFSDNLYNSINGKFYNIHNVDFKSTWTISDLNTPPISYNNPEIIDINGETIKSPNTTNQALSIKYKYSDGVINYKCIFIVNNPGLYSTSFFSYINGQDVDITSCSKEDIQLHYIVNNRGDNNYDFLKLSKDSIAQKASLEEFNNRGGYCFYVK